MKKFFLDQFYIKSVSTDLAGRVRLNCYAIEDNQLFFFNMSICFSEFEAFLSRIRYVGSKISGFINGARTFYNFKKAKPVDFCWLKIRTELLPSSEYQEVEEYIYMVENFGFIPE
ncbi:MAG: hypothetical protein ACK4ND_13645 [Cytophagaceae bacterium]